MHRIRCLAFVAMACATAMGQNGSRSSEKPQSPPPSPAQTGQPAPAPAPKPQARARVNVELAKFERADPGKMAKQSTVGAARGSGDRFPLPLAPNEAVAYSTSPLFSWSYPGPTRRFVFVLTDRDGNELQRETVNGYEYRYPASALPLEAGHTYNWTVQPESAASGSPSPPMVIAIMGGGERRQLGAALNQAATGDPLQRIQAFVDAGVWYDTIDAVNTLITADPNDPDLLELRGEVLQKVEATRAIAKRDLDRAREIRGH